MNKLKTAIEWRKNYYRQPWLKFQWKVKREFDFLKRKKIDSISVVVVGRNDNYGGDFYRKAKF